MDDNSSAPYSKVLILGAIAAASAFVVTILILLVCVGCQRKNKSKHGQANEEAHRAQEAGLLRQAKLSSMSKSDTRLHEMNRLPCNANGVPKTRPASMDLLLLHSRRSTSDLRPPPGLQLPQIPTGSEGEEHDHTYSEVGYRASPSRCLDDGLYESVGVKGNAERDPAAPPPAPPPTSANTPAQRRAHAPPVSNGDGAAGSRVVNGVSAEAVTAEYASIRKVKKVGRGPRVESGGGQGEAELQHLSSTDSSTSSSLHRKSMDPFHPPNFPKEAVFMGNGEQYIWKPPEIDDIMIPPGMSAENGMGHVSAAEIADMYSTVCKTLKRKPPQGPPQGPPQEPPQEPNGLTSPPPGAGGEEGLAGPKGWPGGGAPEEARCRRRSQEGHCYELVGEKTWPRGGGPEADPAYATIDAHRKRERQACHSATLRPKKKLANQQQQQGPSRALTNENFYESIGEVKQGASAASTTTIFTFNDGMEMYVTGL